MMEDRVTEESKQLKKIENGYKLNINLHVY
jgi:hypothetical protein